MCNLNTHTFTYFADNKPPVWSTTSPDPFLTHYTSFDVTPVRDAVLYNINNVHYELLVTPESRLALQGYVPDRLPYLVGQITEDPIDALDLEDPIDVELEELIDVEEDQKSDKDQRKSSSHDFLKQDTMSYQVEGLGHVHQAGEDLGPIPQVVADGLHSSPSTHSCGSSRLIGKLQLVHTK